MQSTNNQYFESPQFAENVRKKGAKNRKNDLFADDLIYNSRTKRYELVKNKSNFSIRFFEKNSILIQKVNQVGSWFNVINWWSFFWRKFLPIGAMITIVIALVGALPKAFDLLAKPMAAFMEFFVYAVFGLMLIYVLGKIVYHWLNQEKHVQTPPKEKVTTEKSGNIIINIFQKL